MHGLSRRALMGRVCSGAVGLLVVSGAAIAQQAVRVRGEIERVDGPLLAVKGREGDELIVRVADNASVAGLTGATLADIKPGTFVGIGAMPMPDGRQRAMQVVIFPESMRGAGEGHRPWDRLPESTMTNATVAETVAAVDGPTLTLKYPGGEKVIVVPPEAVIVMLHPGDKSELKVGAKLYIGAATKQPDGTLSASRFTVGRNGMTPPM